ncbi:DNA replication protein DnaC [Staphylococcus xylosus]|uniref:ATP-binding protein n=1 Tax=Staphylococcus xylosus TaxID=1288 RepID=UPI0008532FC4|nr:ATP-binding protein [Staphylococcus xylosus]OEL06879.1 DNA replication protein DnaC [Staphylococcus xylosus]
MNPFENIAKQTRFKNNIIKQEHGLKCDKCGRTYDYYKFDNGQVVKDGCDCEMIELAKQKKAEFDRSNKVRKANKIFKLSIINDDLKDVSFASYNSTSEELEKAKNICVRYANNFDLNNKQSLILHGTFGTGKSHLSMSIAKTVKSEGYSVLYMNVPQLITTYKSTFNNSMMSERELDNIIADVDLLILDDYGTSLTSYGIGKMFEVMESRTGKHNVITTNSNSKELTVSKDYSKLFSRMMKNGTIINMNGEDYRMRGIKF